MRLAFLRDVGGARVRVLRGQLLPAHAQHTSATVGLAGLRRPPRACDTPKARCILQCWLLRGDARAARNARDVGSGSSFSERRKIARAAIGATDAASDHFAIARSLRAAITASRSTRASKSSAYSVAISAGS